MNANTTSPLETAQLGATSHTDAAGNHLTRWTLTLGDLCDWLTVMGRLDADALNAL